MTKLYSYLFYRAFDLIKLTGSYDLAWGASHCLSLFLSLFIVNLMEVFKENIEWKTLGFVGLFIYVSIHIINYLIFLKEDKYKDIIENYSKETKQQRRIGRLSGITLILLVIYAIF